MSPLRDLPTRSPRRLVVLAILATLLAVACCILRLRPETSIEGLLDPSDPAVHALGNVLNHFPITGELLVLATLPDDSPPDDARLRAFAERLTIAANEPEANRSIASIAYRPSEDYAKFITQLVVPNAVDYLDDDAFAAAMRQLTRAGMDEQLARIRAALSLPGPAAGGLGKALAKNDPLNLFSFLTPQLSKLMPGGMGSIDPMAMVDSSKAAFFSTKHRSLLIRIAGVKPPSDLNFCHQISDLTRHLVDQSNTDGLHVEMTGAYVVASYNADAIRHDAIVGVNGSIVGIALLFLVLYRRPLRMFLFAFTPMAMGIAWGFGALALMKPAFTPLAAVVGGALGGIGIDYLVFYLAHHDYDRAAIADRAAAVRATSARLRGALRTAWLTSVVGFISVGWSPIHVLRDFALLGTLALGRAYLAAVVLLPATLTAFDRQRRPLATTRLLPVVRPLGRFLARRPVGVFIGASTVLAAACGYLAFFGHSLAPASDLMLLHPHPNPPIDSQRRVTSEMGIAAGSLQLYLQADSSTNLLVLAHDVDRRLRDDKQLTAAGFAGSLSLANVLPDPDVAARRRAAIEPALPSRLQHDFPAALRDAGFNVASYARYDAFLQRLVTPGPPPAIASLAAYPAIQQLVLPREATDAREALCMVFFNNPLERRDQRDAAIAALTRVLDGIERTGHGSVIVTGMPVVSAHVESAIRRDLPKLALAAVIWIAICHAFHFRSVGLAALSMVPTAISALAVLVFMSRFEQPLNLVNMVMVPLLLGIDTDYGILTVAAYQSAGGSRRRLLRAFPTAVSAVITCAAATVIGFGSLVLVSIPAVRSLGWLINVGIVACLVGTIVTVWPVMFWMSGRQKSASS